MTAYTRKLAARRTIGAWKPAPRQPRDFDHLGDACVIVACLIGMIAMAVYG